MVMARRALVLASIVALLGSPTLIAQRGNAGRGGRGGGGLTDAQRKAIQAITALADDAAAGRPAPNDMSLVWVHDDVLKVAVEGQAFVPFIVTIDPSKVPAGPVSVYWRVVSKDAPAAPPPSTDKKDKDKKDDKKPAAPSYAYESLTEATVAAGQQPMRISRSFTTLSGNYDVYVVVKEGSATGENKKPDKNAPAPKVSVIRHPITVPDLWNGELNTSSVIIAEKLEQLTAPLSALEKVNRPYALGGIEIIPYTRTKFAKKEELDAFILIYNAKTAEGKPDVKVEFNFYTKQAGGEKFFNSTLPANLNGQTLSAQDLAAGQLQAGQAVPLGSFPEGDYRLEIKVIDNVAKKELKRDVNFSVTGS